MLPFSLSCWDEGTGATVFEEGGMTAAWRRQVVQGCGGSEWGRGEGLHHTFILILTHI